MYAILPGVNSLTLSQDIIPARGKTMASGFPRHHKHFGPLILIGVNHESDL